MNLCFNLSVNLAPPSWQHPVILKTFQMQCSKQNICLDHFNFLCIYNRNTWLNNWALTFYIRLDTNLLSSKSPMVTSKTISCLEYLGRMMNVVSKKAFIMALGSHASFKETCFTSDSRSVAQIGSASLSRSVSAGGHRKEYLATGFF